MRHAISNIAWQPGERLAAYEAMAAWQVTGLEIAPGLFFHAAEDPFRPDAASARAAMAEIEAAGLALVSMQSLLYGVEGAILFGDPTEKAAFERGMVRAIDLAGRFGIPNLVFGSPAQRRVPEGLAMHQAMEEAAAMMWTLGERAAAAGTVISLEPNPAAYGTNFLNRLDEVELLVQLVGHPAVMINLDLGAMRMNGEYETTADRTPALADRIGHVHVSEPHLQPAPADAAALAPVLTALAGAGYARAVSIEMRRPDGGIAEVERSLARLVVASGRIVEPEARHEC